VADIGLKAVGPQFLFASSQRATSMACLQVAVFDTTFHATLAPDAYMYALPYEMYEKYRIRR
jgi:acetate kinase